MRALLAFLLLHANELLSSDRLIDEVWGPDPPKTAGASLQNYVSRLRKAIGTDLIVSQPPGYVLRVDPQHFDLARFERLVTEARTAPLAERAEKLRAALGLWRGRALEDLAFEPFVRDEAGRLEEERLAALEERIDADLALGADHDLVVELEALVEENPLRERLRGELMLALYRAGRQAKALEAYQDARRTLLDELGLEPSDELRALHQAILQHDPTLAANEPAAVRRPPDRRTVTVLFCDLVDSTKLAAELDPEVYRRLMSRYFEVVRGPIARHGGTLEKFVGDAVMAVFGVPELHEDDALRALRAAQEAQAALREEVWQVPLAARIGVSTGEVHVLSSAAEDLHISGAAASVAAGLEERAPPGGIFLSAETRRLAHDAVRATAVDDAWRLDEVVGDAAPYTRHLDAPLVGRGAELERLLDAYAHARKVRRCCVVTVVGEAGIGKTRLARELVRSSGDKARVLVGRCVSYGEGATYLPIGDIVRSAADENTVAGIRKLLSAEDDADAISQRIAELTGIADSPAAPGEAFWAVRRLLEALARARPLLLVLDDIHWAEPTLLDLIEYLGEWAEGPMLVVCLARRELLEQRHGWGGPTSTGFLVELDRLPAEALTGLVDQLADGSVDADVRQRIVEYSGGNPLFAEQLLAFAADAPDLTLEKPPPNVEALLASRLDRLNPRDLGVLRRAAVLDRTFTSAQLEDLGAGTDTGRVLQDLTERRFVRPVRDVFRFHHVMVRDVAYAGIPKEDRAKLHELAARGLDRRDGGDELIGYHFEQAHRYRTELMQSDEHVLELAAVGGERLGRAGIRAWKRADAPAAVNLLDRAVHLLPRADTTRRELACELGVALRMRGDAQRAKVVLGEAARESAAVGDRRVELRAQLELANLKQWGEEGGVAADLLDLARLAIPTFESCGDERALGRAWLSVGLVEGGLHCEYARWEESAQEAASHYRRAGWSPSTCLSGLAAALFYGPRPVVEALSQCEELLDDSAGDHASEANILVWMGGLEAMAGRFDDGRKRVADAREIFTDLGQIMAVGDTCGLILGAIEMLAGAPEAAERELRRSCETLEAISETALLATRAAELAEAIYAQGRYEEANSWTQVAERSAGVEDVDAAFSWRAVKAKALARREAFGDARRLIQEAVELVSQTDALTRHGNVLLDFAEICRLAHRNAESDRLVRQATALYELKGNIAAAERARSPFITRVAD